MKIITGIGRCGTSFLTKYCKEIGLNIGEAKWIEKYDAGLEDRETIVINEHILKNGYDSTAKKLFSKLPKRDIIKDPRFLYDANTIKYWLNHFPDLEVIYLTRNYSEIVASQKRKPSMTTPAFRCFEDEIEIKEKAFLSVLSDLNIQTYIFTYPNFLNEAEAIKNVLGGDVDVFNKLRYDI